VPTAYYMDIINLTTKILLSESAINARHVFNVLFSTLQFMDEETIKSTAEETISIVFDKIDNDIKDKRVMLAGITLLRLFFSISSAPIGTSITHSLQSYNFCECQWNKISKRKAQMCF